MNAARAARTTEAVVITVPGSPSPEVAPNRRAHGFAKAAATAQHRKDAKIAAYTWRISSPNPPYYLDLPEFDGPVAVSALIRCGKGQRRHELDSCALMVKPYLDGFTDIRIWRDDAQINRLTVQQERDPSGRGEVVIRVEAMP